MAELVDALVSGTSVRKDVRVQVPLESRQILSPDVMVAYVPLEHSVGVRVPWRQH